MITAKLVHRHAAQFKQDLERKDTQRVKAAHSAAKGQGFELMKKLQADLRAGKAGHSVFKPLSVIASKLFISRRSKRKPLARMAKAVRYRAMKKTGAFLVQVGFVDPNRGAKLSKRWVHLAHLHQEGGEVSLKDVGRWFIRRWGFDLAGKGDKDARFFMIKKTTTSVNVPSRPIIDPFWQANKAAAARGVADKYKKKLRGERF